MRFAALTVGRPKAGPLADLHDEYAERVRRLGHTYEALHVAQTRPDGKYADEHVREREAAALLARIEKEDALIALDPSGELVTSEALARRLERFGSRRVVFAIGGPLGLGRSLLARADLVLSLSRLTFAHEWVRAIVSEQLYRALTIQRGVPYHK